MRQKWHRLVLLLKAGAVVENLVVPVIFGKMFIDEVQKLCVDVCLNVHAVGRVEPNYVSLPVLAAVLCGVSCRFLAFSEH